MLKRIFIKQIFSVFLGDSRQIFIVSVDYKISVIITVINEFFIGNACTFLVLCAVLFVKENNIISFLDKRQHKGNSDLYMLDYSVASEIGAVVNSEFITRHLAENGGGIVTPVTHNRTSESESSL